jgi:hypothetical protein
MSPIKHPSCPISPMARSRERSTPRLLTRLPLIAEPRRVGLSVGGLSRCGA